MFSDRERRIADYLITNSDPKNSKLLLDMSVNKFASETRTSPATVIRFCKAIGFNGLSELKYYIRKGVLSPGRRYESISLNDSTSSLRQKTAMFNKYALDDTTSILNDEDLTTAAEKLAKARRILIIGEGSSGSSARAALFEFKQIGLDCMYAEDSYFQMLSVGQLTKDDVLLAISHSGRAANTIDAVKYASENGIYVIGITSIVGSILTKYCDTVLYICNMEHEFFSNTIAARICELNVISVLHSCLSQILYKQIPEQEKIVNMLYEIKRVNIRRS